MFKLAQNAFKPMSAHIPKVTNPFASAKPMPLNINGTGYTPPVKTWNSSAPVKNDSYFGGLYNDLKSVGAGINNFVKSTVDTGNRAVKGWGRLVDPTSSTTIGQRAGWLGKGLTSVGEDFAPGMGQGIINLPANTVKGLSNIGTGVVNSLSGGFFDKAKKNVDNFTSKLTNPFKVNFGGDRTGVAQESFNVGQFTGETAATAGAGAAAKVAKNLVNKRITRFAGDMKKEVVATPKPKRDSDFDNALTELTFKRGGLANIKSLDDVNFNGNVKSPLSGFYGTPHEGKYSAYLERNNGMGTGRFVDYRKASIEDREYLGNREVMESPKKGYVTRFKLKPEYVSKIKKADYTSEPYSMKLPRMKEYLKNDVSGIANWDQEFTKARGRGDSPLDEIVVFQKEAIDPKSFETNLVHQIPDGRLARTKPWVDEGKYVAPALLSPFLLKGQNDNTNKLFGNNHYKKKLNPYNF